jgi:arylsulfatase A-like enzyme
MIGLAHLGFRMHDYGTHIIHTLAESGYESTLIGIHHIVRDTGEIGFDRVVETGGKRVEHNAPAAVDFLEDGPRTPFFLSVGFSESHRPFHEPGSMEDPRYTLPPHPIPDTPESRREMAGFKASVRVLDQGVGSVMHALDESGLAEDTLVICTTDHGIAFPGMKCTLFDGGTGVMLVMRGPGGFSGGRVLDGLVSQIDIYPTICDLLGIDAPPRLEGRSMMPLIRGERDEINDQIFTEINYHVAYDPQRAVRTRRWKYVRRFADRDTPVMCNVDDSPSKDVWLTHGWQERRLEREALYDLTFDPDETHNLADDACLSSVLDHMRAHLDDWMKKTNDPLLSGHIAAPEGARLLDADSLSPSELNR